MVIMSLGSMFQSLMAKGKVELLYELVDEKSRPKRMGVVQVGGNLPRG